MTLSSETTDKLPAIKAFRGIQKNTPYLIKFGPNHTVQGKFINSFWTGLIQLVITMENESPVEEYPHSLYCFGQIGYENVQTLLLPEAQNTPGSAVKDETNLVIKEISSISRRRERHHSEPQQALSEN